jgi:hypothetical protein
MDPEEAAMNGLDILEGSGSGEMAAGEEPKMSKSAMKKAARKVGRQDAWSRHAKHRNIVIVIVAGAACRSRVDELGTYSDRPVWKNLSPSGDKRRRSDGENEPCS